jgi:hypothetical protein
MGLASHVRPRLSYGASPLHLAGHVAALAVVAYALSQVLQVGVLVWLVGGALLHDLVLLPLYSLADRVARSVARGVVNHVRVPAAISGVLLLVYFPLILGKAPANYERNTGRHPPDYLARWLAITAGLCVVSAVVWASGRRRRT